VDSRRDGNTRIGTWIGDNDAHLDTPGVYACGHVLLGIYGGNTRAGAWKNEDAALILVDTANSWEFAVLVDAHHSAESAQLVLTTVESQTPGIKQILDQTPLNTVFRQLEDYLVQTFSSPDFRARARQVQGEASCLICGRKGRFIWWMSIGDCLVYLLHPQLAALGQFALNQRSFYEWVGLRNTFDLPVPCYASGVREMNDGRNVICMATDGLFEIETWPPARDTWLYRTYHSDPSGERLDLQARTRSLLDTVHQANGRDSATAIVWEYEASHLGVHLFR
jgi:hypothetical protein